MPESVTRLEALNTGSVDVLMPLEPAQVSSAESSGVVVSDQAIGSYLNLAIRTDRAPFDDIRVRRALQRLTDRATIVEATAYGRGEVANDHPIPPFDPHFWSGQAPGYDIAEAKKLLGRRRLRRGLTSRRTQHGHAGHPELAIAKANSPRPGW
jgi:peptide/nickel transport system substrate-binding protein